MHDQHRREQRIGSSHVSHNFNFPCKSYEVHRDDILSQSPSRRVIAKRTVVQSTDGDMPVVSSCFPW